MGKDNVDVPAPRQTSIKALQDLAERAAERNIQRSIALEEQYAPSLAAARGAYENQLLRDVQGVQGLQEMVNRTAAGLEKDFDYQPEKLTLPPLAANPIQDRVNSLVMADLANPGQLPLDVRNLVARSAAQSAGQSGILGSRAAGGITARDLGTTSLALRDANIQRGNAVGQQERALALAQQNQQNVINQLNQQFQQANLARRAQTSQQLANLVQPLRQSMGAVGATPRPTAGLGPGEVASIQVGQDNSYNQYLQQMAAVQAGQNNANLGFWGGIAGLGLGTLLTPISGKSLIGRAFT